MNRNAVLYQVLATTPMGRQVFDLKVEGFKEAVRAAKFYNRSGYTTVIHQLRETESGGYHLVKAGRPRAPKSPPRHAAKQWEKTS